MGHDVSAIIRLGIVCLRVFTPSSRVGIKSSVDGLRDDPTGQWKGEGTGTGGGKSHLLTPFPSQDLHTDRRSPTSQLVFPQTPLILQSEQKSQPLDRSFSATVRFAVSGTALPPPSGQRTFLYCPDSDSLSESILDISRPATRHSTIRLCSSHNKTATALESPIFLKSKALTGRVGYYSFCLMGGNPIRNPRFSSRYRFNTTTPPPNLLSCCTTAEEVTPLFALSGKLDVSQLLKRMYRRKWPEKNSIRKNHFLNELHKFPFNDAVKRAKY
ncbi:hypothetical protein J6590_006173 [Homalodisca vitripennis]|nr:hypothetical protein J6590_006173 [Homalodisca vitripennis]